MHATLDEIDCALNHIRETRRRYAQQGNTAGVTVATSFADRLLDQRLAYTAVVAA